jgi:hypothetical protein
MKKHILVILIFSVLSIHSHSQETVKIFPSEGKTQAYFGFEMALEDDFLAASSWNISQYNSGGIITIFKVEDNNIIEHQNIIFEDAGGVSLVDHHGSSLDMVGDRLIAGTYFASTYNASTGWAETGFACVYKRNTNYYELEGILIPPDGKEDDRFGEHVSIYGDYAIVGASNTEDFGKYTGSAYVYHYNGTEWEFEQKLLANNAQSYVFFGSDVSIHKDLIAVGAKHVDNKKGAVYIFQKSGQDGNWIQTQKIVPQNIETDDEFGTEVILDENLLLCRSTGKGNLMNYRQGAIYTYIRDGNTWMHENTITCPDAEFGTSEYPTKMDFCDNKLAITDFGNLELSPGAGSVYVFDIVDGNPENYRKVLPPSTFNFSQDYGRSVAIGSNHLFVGCPEDTPNGTNSGSLMAYLNFDVSEQGDSTNATLATISFNGTPLDNFNSNTSDYTVELPSGTTEIPQLIATTTVSGATIYITQANTLPGTATILVTAKDGETHQTYTINFTVITGIGDFEQQDELNIYPNPTAGKFNVQCSMFKVEDATIEIYDLTGKKLIQKQIPSGTENVEIDVSHLKNGVYFCRLVFEKYSTTEKIIIQK